ncbi:AbfB domain-containing protein [Streptomyces sp. NPDC096311]|uniref:AbfB domain-containing protein n=1 Tax=Streptomyces sp. NPDC096311 TaxID=3366083 RepID=UPI00381A0243
MELSRRTVLKGAAILGAAALTGVTFSPGTAYAAAFAHPGIGFNRADLDWLKVNLSVEPFATAYAALRADSHSSLDYSMQGPFTDVGRTPDVHLGEYKNDMQAMYNLSLVGYLTGDTAYSAKATGIIRAWFRTHTTWSGAEPYLTSTDYVNRSVAGADLLRGTYSEWTTTDTIQCKKYFNDVHWPDYSVGGGNRGAGTQVRSAGQGGDQLQGAMAVAAFCDDRTKFDMVVNAYLTDPVGGLRDSLPNGEIGDTGRDQGHAYGLLIHWTFIAETAWKMGVDLFSAENNRLLAALEYFADYNSGGSPAFIKFGTSYDLYSSIGGDRLTRTHEALDIGLTHYVVRKGLSAPHTTAYRELTTEDYQSVVYRRTTDTSTATAPATPWSPPNGSAVTSLTSADIGTVGSAGSTSYANGVWTMTSSGAQRETGYRYAYRALTGDGVITARVRSVGATGTEADAGVMLRSALLADSSSPYVYMRLFGAGGGQVFWRAGRPIVTGDYINYTAMAQPYWVRLVRRGNFVYGYTSPDGTNWSPTCNTLFHELPATVYVGLAVTSGDTSVTNTATFDNVSISTVPATPTGLTATPGAGQIALSWSAAANTLYYEVYRGNSGSGDYSVIATEVTGTSYTDITVGAGGGSAYDYKVAAAGFGGLSSLSASASATAGALTVVTGSHSLRSVNYPTRYIRHQNDLGYLHEATDAQAMQNETFTVVAGLAGTGLSFRALNGMYLRHYDFRIRLAGDDGTDTFAQDATFRPRAGSADGAISLESYNYPGWYLRHRSYELWLDPFENTIGFRADSSFTVVDPLS